MEYLAELDCWITVVADGSMPPRVKAVCTENIDGQGIILINGCLSESARRRAFLHERKHLVRGDLHSDRPAHEIERDM